MKKLTMYNNDGNNNNINKSTIFILAKPEILFNLINHSKTVIIISHYLQCLYLNT